MHKSIVQTGVARLFSMLVVLLAAFAIAVPAYATSTPAEDATASAVTATSTAAIEAKTGNAGDTLNMYKVVDVTYANNQLNYAFTQTFRAFLNAAPATAVYKSLTVDQYLAYSNDSAVFRTLLGDFSAYVKTNSATITADKTATTDGDGVANFTGVGLGQYIIVGMGNVAGAKIYSTVTAEVVPYIDDSTTPATYKIYDKYEVDLKTTEPTGEKEIIGGTTPDGDNATVSIGDVIKFRLSGDVPTYPAGATNTTLFMADTLSAGLTLNPASVKVYMAASADDIDDDHLLSDTGENKAYTVTIDGQTLYVDYVYSKLTPGQKLFVTYDATLNEQAVIGGAGNPNNYTYTYSNNPFNGGTHEHDDIPEGDNGYGTVEDSETVYSYGLYIYKTAEDTGNALGGAKFQLRDSSGKLIAILVTDDNGYVAYSGLAAGTYTLHEIEAPTGYTMAADTTVELAGSSATSSVTTTSTSHYTSTKPSEDAVQATNAAGIKLWVKSGGDGLIASDTQPDGYLAAYLVSSITSNVSDTPTNGVGAGAGYYPANIQDKPGSSLPVTGGMGTVLLYGAGIALVAGAVVLYMKRRQSADRA